jgi:Fuc2NAc and GlcNAc transferase
MDGINGIAGITGVVGFGLIALFGVMSGVEGGLVVLSACIGLACLGFLPFNMPGARVFMGDVGSVLLGFVFAALVVALFRTFTDFVVLCAFLFPFYADELNTEYVRLRDGENLLAPHRRHIYQLLANEMKIPHWKVSTGYGLLQVVIGFIVLGIRGYGTAVLIVFIAACFTGFWVFGRLIRNRTEGVSR